MHKRPKVIEIFDRKLVRVSRNRAFDDFENHDFLIKHANKSLLERLDDVKRDFDLALLLGARGVNRDDLNNSKKINEVIISDLAESFLAPNQLSIQSDEEFLPFKENSFDLIMSNHCLHSVNDLPGALIQINNSLKPDGLFLGALLGGGTLFELRKSLMQAEIKIKGGASAHIAPFANQQQLGSLLQRAKFALPVVDAETITVSYNTLDKLMHDIRGMGESNALKERRKITLGKEMLALAEDIYKEQFSDDDGKLTATFEIIYLIGWAPHSSQQKPMRPGSAKKRLSDALKTKEIKT